MQEVLLGNDIWCCSTKSTRGATKLIVIVIIVIIKGETYSIKQDPVPNMGQVEFTYVIV